MSWIHVDDHVGLMLHAIATAALSGPVNATAPNPVTNKTFGRTLGKVLKRPAVLPTPPVALKALFGESADILATGQRVIPKRALESGYKFAFPELEPALRDAVSKF
jgi:NAD dependent epimerase/dehydratase family enzyme